MTGSKVQTIEVVPFTQLSSLLEIEESKQLHYLYDYLTEMGAKTVIVENSYFDRDYLSEFAAFYSVSSRSYSNLCRRLHFFEEPELTLSEFQQALGGDRVAHDRMQRAYLGFVVQRPLAHAPLGRTALKWYPDLRSATTPRIMNPSRRYEVHLAGLRFTVESVAWQQQDRGVGSCATVGMWSMLHSSALDEFHAIPTTAAITLVGSDHAPMGRRAFPSTGLTMAQLCEVIKAQDLAPLMLEGDILDEQGVPYGFSPALFSASVASLIRSDYPVLIGGKLNGSGVHHAVCAVGFREVASSKKARKPVELQDEQTKYFFLHDDNLGPNVRFCLGMSVVRVNGKDQFIATLKAEAPARRFKTSRPSATDGYPVFIPKQLVAAAHQEVRSTPGELLRSAHRIAICFGEVAKFQTKPAPRITVSGRFIRLSDYLGVELERVLKNKAAMLASTRMALMRDVRPMSLHIGVGRIGLSDSTPLVDVLYDTTDCQLDHSIFGCVCYNQFSQKILLQLQVIGALQQIPIVAAY